MTSEELDKPRERQSELAAEDIHDVLSNKRRRMTLEYLQENNGEMDARELSEQIATNETGENPPPRNIRQSAYVSLIQTHLPRLDDLGIITFEKNSKHIELQDNIDQVSVYLETVPKYGISWSELYTGLAAIGILSILGSEIGVPILSTVSAVTWAYLYFGLIGASAALQTHKQGSSIIHRLASD